MITLLINDIFYVRRIDKLDNIITLYLKNTLASLCYSKSNKYV